MASKIKTRIIITEREDGTVDFERAAGDLTFSLALDLACSVLNGCTKEIRTALAADDTLSEEDKEKAVRELFDLANISFSRSLELNFPEIDLHPEMTEDVMKRAIEIETKRARRKARRLEAAAGKPTVIPINRCK